MKKPFLLSLFALTVGAANRFAFLDLSGSSKDQRGSWTQLTQDKVCNVLASGDRIAIYAAGFRTADRAALLDETMPVLGKTQSSTFKLRKLKEKCRDTVEKAFQGALERETALIEMLGRLPSDRPIKLAIVSDAVESSGVLDIERTPLLSLEAARAAAQRVIRKLNLPAGTLSRVQVAFVLDSPPSDAKRPATPRAALREFWQTILTHCGARLVSFDPDLPAGF